MPIVSRLILLAIFLCLQISTQSPAAELFEVSDVFDNSQGVHGHVHASCIVECPNGDLRVVWYENGPTLPPPYFNKQKDKSDDVRTGGARKAAGAKQWDPPFVMADTFGLADDNPCLIIDKQQQLWLVRPTLLGVPEWTWGSSLLRFQVSADYLKPGRPVWKKEDILVPHVEGLETVIKSSLERMKSVPGVSTAIVMAYNVELQKKLRQPLATRLGWMPRAHPLIRRDGAIVVPISNENFNVALMAISQDAGETWTFSKPVPEIGLTQPTLVEFPDGRIAAFFRNSDPRRRIKRSDSTDGGLTWSTVEVTSLPHLGSGIEAFFLPSGALAMAYNDKEQGPRDRLTIAVSEDGGKTWPVSRRLADVPEGRFDYPSVVVGKDGTLHATYTDGTKSIKYVHFNEEWIRSGKK